MKTTYTFIIGLLTLMLSCERTDPSIIEFDGHTFELPIKVDKAIKVLGLQYGYYSGFFNGNENGILIGTQLKGLPLFMGSDNNKEEKYYSNYLVGITFFKEDSVIEKYKIDLEKQYKDKFNTEIKDFGSTRTLPPFNMTYHYIKADDGLFIALKEISRNPNERKYISISFYKEISERELAKYLEYIN